MNDMGPHRVMQDVGLSFLRGHSSLKDLCSHHTFSITCLSPLIQTA
jgi:hypothetical protein